MRTIYILVDIEQLVLNINVHRAINSTPFVGKPKTWQTDKGEIRASCDEVSLLLSVLIEKAITVRKN